MVRQVESRATGRIPRERWRGLLAEWSASGQTQAAFCRARGLNAGTFAWWKRQLRGEERGATGATVRRGRRPWQAGRFVEVRLAGASGPAYEIVLSCGRSIRVPLSFDASALSRLIAAVEAAPVRADGGGGVTC
jgi:hypothetical protein